MNINVNSAVRFQSSLRTSLQRNQMSFAASAAVISFREFSLRVLFRKAEHSTNPAAVTPVAGGRNAAARRPVLQGKVA